jgi:type IV pilus assembly protein PilF
MRHIAAALVLAAAAGCVSQTAVETRQVTDAQVADARRRAEVHTALAGEYYSRGNYAVALQETRLALKDDSSYFQAYNMQGLVYMELREDGPARESFDQALRLSPNNPEVLNNFGWFLCVRNEGDRGLGMIERAASDPLYATPEKALLSAGLCLRRLGRKADAEDRLRRAVMIRPDMVGALYNLAELSYDRGATKDAENYLVRTMRVATPSQEALVLGVKIARANKDRAGEESYLQQLRRRFPDSPQLGELERTR